MEKKAVRLNKFLAQKLGISRRLADDLIVFGAVKVNQNVAKLGQRIDFSDNVCYNEEMGAISSIRGRLCREIKKRGENFVALPEDFEEKLELLVAGLRPEKLKYTYVALNKPVGYVCSKHQQAEAPTIFALLPKKWQDLKTVGRLDKDSSGLILLTNDGDFTFRMTHPSFTKTKIYEVELDRPLSPLHQQEIAEFGIEIGDGVSKLGLEREDETRKRWKVSMHEGRNRQIRRTFGALGYTVVALKRIQFGPYQLTGLKEGEAVEVPLVLV